jgi:hypothetical protein
MATPATQEAVMTRARESGDPVAAILWGVAEGTAAWKSGHVPSRNQRADSLEQYAAQLKGLPNRTGPGVKVDRDQLRQVQDALYDLGYRGNSPVIWGKQALEIAYFLGFIACSKDLWSKSWRAMLDDIRKSG